jgi:tetratricopeptide (TPR) repeat protein
VPFTLNGIGTHYYGAKNRSARVDVCASCGRSATLSSYDTREWFCVLFIPLIPITKYRIIDDCSSCRKHHRMTAAAFADQVTGTLAPLREAVRRSPSDPQPYADLVNGLIAWGMREDARKEVEAALTKFPRSAALHMLGGQLAIDRAQWDDALPYFERAQALEPQNAAAVYGHGWLLHHLGHDADAVNALQRAISLGENHGALYLLGISQSRLGRWNEAVQTYQRLLAIEPAYMNDKAFLRLMAEAKRNVGYELTDAERRASRRWWPFGGGAKKQKQPKLQAGPTLVRPALRIPGLIILGMVILGGAFYAWDRYANADLHIDNGLGRAVKVELDGKQFDLGAHAHAKESLSTGAHTIVIRESDGQKEIERLSFTLPSTFDSVLHDRFFVYNVSASTVYRRTTHGYAVRAEDSTYGEELVVMKRFFEQRDVDYPFSTPPETLKMDAGSSSVNKVAFNVASDIPLAAYAAMRVQEGLGDEAMLVMRQAVANAPCDTNVRRTELFVFAALGNDAAAAGAARKWIGDCAPDDLEAHRAYQQVEVRRGRHDVVFEEYRQRLAATPESAQAHYLVGRIANDPALAIAEHSEAARLDPKMVLPRVALGYVYSEEERYDDALRELAAALEMEGRDPAVIAHYARVAVAKGSPAEAVSKVDQILTAAPKDIAALNARWLLAAASGEWDRARELQKTLAEFESPSTAWSRRLKLLRLKGDDAAVDLQMQAAARDEELQWALQRAKVERALEKRDYKAAAAALGEDDDVILQLYVAGGLMMSGDAAGATQLLTKLAADAKGDYLTMTFVGGLNGSVPVDRVLVVARENNEPQHGWFVAGVRAAVANDLRRAAECFARAVRASSDLEFPYLELKSAGE